jgi:hypothetical protein
MASDQRTARVVGWLFIGTFVFSIPGFLLYGPVLDHAGYVLGGGHDRQIALGALLELLTAACNIGTATMLFPIVKRSHEGLALSYVALRVLESTIIVAGAISLLGVVTLRQDLAGTDAAGLSVAGHTLVAFHDWTFLLGPGFCAGIGNGLLLGYLMWRTGLVAPRMAQFGMVAGAFAFLAASGVLFGLYEPQSHPQLLLTLPEIVWEAYFGIALATKGFRRSSPVPAPALA